MDRQFALPLAFAAAFHGALLFSFGHPSKHDAPRFISVIKPFVLSPPVDDPPPPIETEDQHPKPDVAPPQPMRQPEPVPIDEPTIPFRPPPVVIDAHNVADDLRMVPVGGREIGPQIESVIPGTLLDRTPHTRFQPAPTYPYEAKKAGLTGEVVVEFIVDESGHVHDPRVVSSTHRVFEEPTLRAVARWVFEPGRRGGDVVRFRMVAPVVFNLND